MGRSRTSPLSQRVRNYRTGRVFASRPIPRRPPASQPVVPQGSDPAPVKDDSLTDTQVLRILETRRVSAVRTMLMRELRSDRVAPARRHRYSAGFEGGCRSGCTGFLCCAAPMVGAADRPQPRAALLYSRHIRSTRQKIAAERDVPAIFFGWASSQSALCEASRCPSALDLRLRSYRARCRAGGHARTRSRQGPSKSRISWSGVDQGIDSNGTPGAAQSKPLSDAPRLPFEAPRQSNRHSSRLPKRKYGPSDSLSETGVRHLRVEVQEPSSGRWKKFRLSANAGHVESTPLFAHGPPSALDAAHSRKSSVAIQCNRLALLGQKIQRDILAFAGRCIIRT